MSHANRAIRRPPPISQPISAAGPAPKARAIYMANPAALGTAKGTVPERPSALLCRRTLALRGRGTFSEQEESEQETQRRTEGRRDPQTGHLGLQFSEQGGAAEEGDQGRGAKQRPDPETEDQEQKPEAAVLEVRPAGENEDGDRRNLRQRDVDKCGSSH